MSLRYSPVSPAFRERLLSSSHSAVSRLLGRWRFATNVYLIIAIARKHSRVKFAFDHANPHRLPGHAMNAQASWPKQRFVLSYFATKVFSALLSRNVEQLRVMFVRDVLYKNTSESVTLELTTKWPAGCANRCSSCDVTSIDSWASSLSRRCTLSVYQGPLPVIKLGMRLAIELASSNP